MSSELKIAEFPVKKDNHPETAEKILSSYPVFIRDMKDPSWLAGLRGKGRDYVLQHGLPTPKREGWKYTNAIPLIRDYGDMPATVKMDVNGQGGVDVTPLGNALDRQWVQDLLETEFVDQEANADPALSHLANAYLRDGVVIDVPANTVLDKPLEIMWECAAGEFYVTHQIIRIGANAHVTIVEDDRGTGSFWKNNVTHIVVEQGAHLTHIRMQEESDESVLTHNIRVTVAKDAHYNAMSLNTGAAMTRNQNHVLLTGTGALCHLNAATLLRKQQHGDTTILIDHLAPNCESNQNMRSILDDRAHGVFQGKVYVHQPAQKTNGYQLSRAIILSEGAEMDTKPELEIYADDVKCSHGATTGQLDEEPLFYMQSRGIPANEARALLIESFAQDVFDEVGSDDIKAVLLARLRGWLYPKEG